LFIDGAFERRTEGSWVVLVAEGRKLENLRDGVADDLVPCVEGAEDALTITVGGVVAKGRELLPITPEGDLLADVAIVEGAALDDVASIEGLALAVVASGEGGKEELPAAPIIEGAGDGRMLIPRNGDGADVRVGNCVGPALATPVGLAVAVLVAVASFEGGELVIDVPCKSLNLPIEGLILEVVEGLLVAPLLVGLVVAPGFEGLLVAPPLVGKTIRDEGLDVVVGTC